MTGYILGKAMNRRLTADEETQVKEYIKGHQEESFENIMVHFEQVFGMTVTMTCIQRLAMELYEEEEKG